MSEVELQEHQNKSVEQNSLPDEVRLDNKLKELGDLEKEIFSGDGIIDGQSSDTRIDEAYKKGLDQAKTIREKLYFIESLVSEFQHERKLQELFQQQEKSPYISLEGKEKLEIGKQKIQELFQKYPDCKEGIVGYMAEKFDYLDYLVKFYENPANWAENIDSFEQEQKKVCETLFNNMWFFENLGDLEKSIQYIQSNSSIDDKGQFLTDIVRWSPENIYNLGEKMEIVSQLSFYQKEGGYKYALKFENSKYDLDLYDLLKCDGEKLQKLDTLFISGNQKQAVDYLEKNFSLTEIAYLMQYDKFKVLYLNVKKESMNIDTTKIGEKTTLALSYIKDKRVFEKIQHHIGEVLNIQNPEDKIKFILSFIKKDLPTILNISTNKLDNCYLFSALREFTYFNLEEQALSKIEVIALELHTLEQKNTQFLQEYVKETIHQLKLSGSTDILYKMHSVGIIDDTNEIKDDGINTDKITILESLISKEGLQISEKSPQLSQSPEKAPNKIPEMQNSLSRLGLNVKIGENGSLIGTNGETNFTQKIGNRTFEVKEDGNIFIQGAFGYEFKYENNINGIEQYLEIADQIEYVDDMGLGHFGTNFKEMIGVLNLYTSYTGLRYINIDDTSLNSTNFVNQVELTNISKAFHKIGFLSTENFSYGFKSGTMQKVEFTHIMQTNFEGRNFFKGGSFDREMFKNVITETNWNK